MSPGSSTHSCVGSNVRRSLISVSSRVRFRRARIGADRPAPPPETLQQEHVVVVDMRTDRAAIDRVAHHDVVDAPARQERKAGSSAATSMSHLSTSCTSSVQSRLRQAREIGRDRTARVRSFQRSRRASCTTMRASAAWLAREPGEIVRRERIPKLLANAPRISSGRFCQCSRRNRAGGMPSGCVAPSRALRSWLALSRSRRRRAVERLLRSFGIAAAGGASISIVDALRSQNSLASGCGVIRMSHGNAATVAIAAAERDVRRRDARRRRRSGSRRPKSR